MTLEPLLWLHWSIPWSQSSNTLSWQVRQIRFLAETELFSANEWPFAAPKFDQCGLVKRMKPKRLRHSSETLNPRL